MQGPNSSQVVESKNQRTGKMKADSLMLSLTSSKYHKHQARPGTYVLAANAVLLMLLIFAKLGYEAVSITDKASSAVL